MLPPKPIPGPDREEARTIEKLDRFLEEHRYVFRGKHHEIYLSDLRRTVPDKMRTVIRYPLA